VRALVVDDHPLIQEAVGNVLRRLEASVQVGFASDCEHGLELANAGSEPDVVLLDLTLPGISGIPALKLWRARFPSVPVIVLSATADHSTVLAAIDAGAAGYISKSSSNEVMLNAVRLVLGGGKYLPMEALRARGDAAASPVRSRGARPSTAMLGLTDRQTEVLRLIACGASNKVICRELGLAERTVKAHVTAVFRALKVSSRTQAAIEAAKLGLGASGIASGRTSEH
jgi:DNA-binding NarL/FixJ family response regulator